MRKLMLLIIGMCVSVGLAAEETGNQHFVWAIDAQIMPEQMEAFMEAKAANARLHAEYNFEFPYFVFVDDFHVHTVFRLDVFAQLDSAPQMFDALDEKTGGKSKTLGQQMSKCVSHRSASIAVYRSDLSYEPENPAFAPDFSKPFYQVVKFFYIKPDKFEEVQVLAKKGKAIDEKRQTPQGYMIYELACGDGVPALVVVMRAQDKVSFLKLEKRLQEKYAEEDAEIIEEALSLITRSETKEGTFVPEASYVPAELKAATPKPSAALRELEGLVGDWTYTGRQIDPDVDIDLPFAETGNFSGKSTARFVLDGAFLETRWHDKEGPSGAMSGMNITGYDPKTKKYTRRGHSSDGTTSARTATLQDGVWKSHATMTTPKGAKVLVKTVVDYAPDWSSYTSTVELSIDQGKTWKHWWKEKGKKVASKAAASTTTREDFEEFCELNKGAWVGEVILREDTPGVGKTGERATAHYDYTIMEDGVALLGKSYWPNGTHTWFVAYDEANKQIESIGISPIFGIAPSSLHYANGKWTITNTSRTFPDGTKAKLTVTGTYSNNGSTVTVTVRGTDRDGRLIDTADVWHRMNKP